MQWYPDLIYICMNVLALFSITYGVSFMIMRYIINWKKSPYKLFLLYVLRGVFVSVGVNTVLKYFYGLLPEFTVFAFIITIVTAVLIVYFEKRWSRDGYLKILLATFIADYTAMFCEGVIILIIFLLTGSMWKLNTEIKPSALLVFAGGILSMVSVKVIGNRFRLFEWYRNRKIKHVFFWSVFFAVNYLFGLFSTFYTTPFDASYLLQPYVITAIALVFLVILYLSIQKIRQKRLYQENQRLQLQQNLLTEYYAALENQVDMTKKMRHDIANHMQTLEALAKQEKDNPLITSYADQLKQSYKSLERMNYCQNIVIDSVIYNKVKICEKENIVVTVDMHSFEVKNLPEIEVLSILYNLFDNAIEACRKIKNEETRFLELRGGNVAGSIVLKMRNSINPEEIHIENGQFLTNKQDKMRHGIGMDIIRDFVKKYDGTMENDIKEKEFEVRISVRDEGV